jgi:Na+-driven multidrug efflux pump
MRPDGPSDATLLKRAGPILKLGAPLIGWSLIPTVVNIATVAMLGRLGNAAIAGVAVAGLVYGGISALLYGADTGVQAIVSRATGAGRPERIPDVLLSAYAGTVPLAAAIGAATWLAGPALVSLILPDRAAAAAGGAWIRLAAPSVVLLAVVLPTTAAWIGSGRPLIAAGITAAGGLLQAGLTFLFIFGAGPLRGLGAVGGALALDATLLAGVFVQLGLAASLIDGFRRGRPRTAALGQIAKIGWPISAQQSLIQVASVGVFAVISQLGAAPAAIANVLLTVTGAPNQVSVGLGIAAATLVGQTLGRGDVSAARRWGWRTTWVVVAVTAPMGLPLALAPEAVLGFFLHDPATLAAAILPGRIAGFGVAVNTASIALGLAFRGAGATKIAAGVPFASLWLLQLPLMIWIGIGLGQGLVGMVWVLNTITAADVILLAVLWAGSVWTRVRIGAMGHPTSDHAAAGHLGAVADEDPFQAPSAGQA